MLQINYSTATSWNSENTVTRIYSTEPPSHKYGFAYYNSKFARFCIFRTQRPPMGFSLAFLLQNFWISHYVDLQPLFSVGLSSWVAVADPERFQGLHGTPLSAKNSPHLPTMALQLKG